MSNPYLDLVLQGKNEFWRYLVGILVILFVGVGLGLTTLIWLNFMLAAAHPPNQPGQAPLPPVPLLLLRAGELLASAPRAMGILLVVRFIHQRPMLTLITPAAKLNWRRIGQGFLVYGGLVLLALLLQLLLFPDRYRFSLEPALFLPVLLVEVLLRPIQTSAEEFLYRGYLLQGVSLLTRRPIVLAFISGLVFALVHLDRPEMQVNFWLLVASYFSAGFFLAWISLTDHSLELALGIHAAHNLASLFIGYPRSPLPVVAVFTTPVIDPVYALAARLVVYVLFYLLIFRRPGHKVGQY